MHSKNYLKIRGYYKAELWDEQRVRSVVGLATGITAEEYKQITGEDYEPQCDSCEQP